MVALCLEVVFKHLDEFGMNVPVGYRFCFVWTLGRRLILIPLGNNLLESLAAFGEYLAWINSGSCRLGCYLQASYEKSEDRGTDGAAVL